MNFDVFAVLDGGARLLLGGNFLVFGLNGFFHWFPIPPARPEMDRFVKGLDETGYLLTVVKVLEIGTGVCLLTGFFVPLALAVLAPLVFGIVSAQLILNRGKGWGISLLIFVPYAALVAFRWEHFLPLLQLR